MHVCFYCLLFLPLFFGLYFNWTYIEGIEHHGTIMDIVAIFKVMDLDTCLFVRISHMVLYSSRVLSVVDQIK